MSDSSEKNLLETALDRFAFVVRYDRDHRVIAANDYFLKISGHKREEIMGQSYDYFQADYFQPEIFATVYEEVIVKHRTWRGELKSRTKFGTHFWQDTTVTPLLDENGDIDEVLFFGLDITVEKETQLKLEMAMRAGKIGTWSYTFADSVTQWSDYVFEMCHVDRVDGPTSYERQLEDSHPDDLKAWTKISQNEIARGENFHHRFRINAASSTKWLDDFGAALFEKDQMIGYVGIIQDITERVNLENERKAAKALMESILDHMPAEVISRSLDGRLVLANKQSLASKAAPLSVTTFTDDEKLILETGLPTNHIEERTARDGSIQHFDTYQFPLRDNLNQVTALTTISIDVSERLRIEKELQHQQTLALHQAQLASIGELAASVGHEINNPLTIVMSYVSQVDRSLKEGGKDIAKNIAMIEKTRKAADRIKNIVGSLRSFARANQESKVTFPFSRPVINSVNLVKELYEKEGIELVLKWDLGKSDDLGAVTGEVLGDEGHIQQVIVNLLSNARDALVNQRQKRITIRLRQSNESGFIDVADSGIGIPAKVKARIFDPFFTTKDVAKGTGLGLSIADSIIKDHQGSISCESREGQGTEFHIELPLYRGPSQSAVAESAVDFNLNSSSGGDQTRPVVSAVASEAVTPTVEGVIQGQPKRGRILIADDEEDLVEIIGMIIKQMGFEVETAPNGLVAFEMAKASKFDALITDMNMPFIHGMDLAKKIRTELGQKDIKIFIITGGINIDLGSEAELATLIDGYFYKPFDHAVLKSTLLEKLGL